MGEGIGEREQASVSSAGMTRREFLRFAGGIVVLFGLAPVAESAAEVEPRPNPADDLNAWLRIRADGRVTIFAPTPEVGQGLRTCLAQMAAEELRVPLSAVEVVLGDTARAPDWEPDPARPALATVGMRVRAAAAEAREILAEMAAERWDVSRDRVTLHDGRVALRSRPETAVSIGELVENRRLVRRLDRPTLLTPPREHEVIGKSIPRLEGPAIVRGRARYAADFLLANMAYAELLRPPCLGARLVQADTRAADAQPGVIAVVAEDDFVAVLASRPDLAKKALRRVQATWDEGAHPQMSTLYQHLRSSAQLAEPARRVGDVEAALAGARRGYSASYRTAFVAHAPIEPHAAVATPQDDTCVVYASTERPFAHREAVAKALGIPATQVRVITADVGGAFGGKDGADTSVHAARLARAIGRPVMITQTREEELTWNYFRPAALIDLRCGVSEAKGIVAWDCDVFNCGIRGASPPYDFPHQRLRSYRCDAPLRQGPWRGAGGPANVFAREVHVDHVASELGEDPIAFRLRHLSDDRMIRVTKTAAARCGWRPRRAPTGLGVGFACAQDAGGCVAEIAEVEVERLSGQVRVRRLVVVQDSGLIVNPDNLTNQIEGAVVMALGFALREAVRYEQGRILTRSFASYPIPTFRDVPEIDAILLPRPELPPGGDGTPALCAVAAAVANAVFDAVGVRLRELPLPAAAIRTAASE